MKYYDCFTFFNELDLLELRFKILDPIVDYFVLVESTCTFTGYPKDLLFELYKSRFQKYLPKIKHVVVTDSPEPTSKRDCWNVEYHQRNAILRGLEDSHPEDKILIGDVDEIPNPESILNYSKHREPIGFRMNLYYYYINCKQNTTWCGTIMVDKQNLVTPQQLRDLTYGSGFLPPAVGTRELGWHFSYLGGTEAIQEKLNAFSETQVNTSAINEERHIQHCLQTGEDLFYRDGVQFKKSFVPLDQVYPNEIYDWINTHPQYLYHV